ncbi:MAG: bifunctional phosphoribosyl-AMP cyclohydrolase/phosphoribosyl-ATP pyrophosphatase, partial [Lachnospiraceae bacterium]|nr:bifunctional phosphoribosyl-AMP cyclohydrolase/phosphoribosyl-ATP pyrophosphatase [Lachnospiraceae bacterium]
MEKIMTTKKFIPCIYLYQTKAVRNLQDTTVVAENPLELVNAYNENNADELIVFDMS